MTYLQENNNAQSIKFGKVVSLCALYLLKQRKKFSSRIWNLNDLVDVAYTLLSIYFPIDIGYSYSLDQIVREFFINQTAVLKHFSDNVIKYEKSPRKISNFGG